MSADYYIELPIGIECGFKCSYCFHSEAFELEKQGRFEEKYSRSCPFTPLQFKAWRDKYLTDANSFLYELHGGEMSYGNNPDLVFEYLNVLDNGKFQLQTNGCGEPSFYKKLIIYKDQIDRIGFTYHREVLKDNPKLQRRFQDNIRMLKKVGFNVYVKELLILDYRDEILKHKEYWEKEGIEFRLQDFRGYRGREDTEMSRYTDEDWRLVHPEYRHLGNKCFCRGGRKSILIRGFDIFKGDVLACWSDPTVIGNIVKDWYTPYESVQIDSNSLRDVIGVEKKYRGSYPRDIWVQGIENDYPNLNIKQINQRRGKMSTWRTNELERLNGELKKANELIRGFSDNIQTLQNNLTQTQFNRAAIEGAIEVLTNESKAEANTVEDGELIQKEE